MSRATSSPVKNIGEQPSLEGVVCEAFVCQGFVVGGEMVNNAGVTFAKFAGIWHRLNIDYPLVFWRRSELAPEPFEVQSEGWSYPHVNVGTLAGIDGQVLVSLNVTSNEDTLVVAFVFANGKRLLIENVDDRSNYVVV
jgi:hypothetical protein